MYYTLTQDLWGKNYRIQITSAMVCRECPVSIPQMTAPHVVTGCNFWMNKKQMSNMPCKQHSRCSFLAISLPVSLLVISNQSMLETFVLPNMKLSTPCLPLSVGLRTVAGVSLEVAPNNKLMFMGLLFISIEKKSINEMVIFLYLQSWNFLIRESHFIPLLYTLLSL